MLQNTVKKTTKPLSPKPAAQPSPKPPGQSATAPPSAKSAVLAQPRKPTAPKKVAVSFTLLRPDAKRVSVCGEFNGWSPSAIPMKRHNDGRWETTVALAPGRYQYKFIVDEEWIADPRAYNSIVNQHGTLNSVLEVRA